MRYSIDEKTRKEIVPGKAKEEPVVEEVVKDKKEKK